MIVFTIFALVAARGQSEARSWRTNPQTLTQEYVLIQDNRVDDGIVMLFWAAPNLIPRGSEGAEVATKILTEHLMIGVVHARIDAQARFYLVKETAPTLRTMDNKSIERKTDEAISPMAQGMLLTV